jgi:predicted glycogen debranching enzyme
MTDLSRGEFARVTSALEREWLVTNGLGGFASGTAAQANTRRYHGLLVAALRPPVERIVMVAKVDATVLFEDQRFELGCNEFADGTLAPRGFERLGAFVLEEGLPVWTYALGDALIEQRIWMERERNTAYVSYTLLRAARSVTLELVPLCTYRDYHAHSRGSWSLAVTPEEAGCTISAFPGARSYRVGLDRGRFASAPEWYWQFKHRQEAERGLDAVEDLFRPGILRTALAPGETVTLTASAEPAAPERAGAWERETRRRRTRLKSVERTAPQWVRRLALAADQFIVRRVSADAPDGVTVIAGYPWFSDWGRDTMIALPGLTLPTGRAADAGAILRTFAAHVSEGMLPNRFPDAGETAEYNTVDATLWFFHAIHAYLEETSDRALLTDLYPTLREIIHRHRQGTRHGIHIDESDGLLQAGEPGVQLTWMDAKVGDWVVTPRIGKPVEINALWHFALVSLARWAGELGDARAAADYARSAARVAAAFTRTYWYERGGYLYDVVDGPDGTPDNSGRPKDATLRPNQIFAVALGTALLDERQARSVVEVCARELLTPVGLRSLAPREAQYAGRYQGGPRERDAIYHQGTVWSWLLGPFALAHYHVYGDPGYALDLLAGLAAHLDEACLGSISEIFDGDPPHTPRGCFAQAWSVAETLRAWQVLSQAQEQHQRGFHTEASGARP